MLLQSHVTAGSCQHPSVAGCDAHPRRPGLKRAGCPALATPALGPGTPQQGPACFSLLITQGKAQREAGGGVGGGMKREPGFPRSQALEESQRDAAAVQG